MTSTATRKTIQPRNTYLARIELTRYVGSSNSFTVWTNTSATVSFCTDALGASPIAGLSSFPLTESGTLGTYYAEISPAYTNLLIPYVGQTIYQVVRAGANLAVPDLDGVVPLLVEQPRFV